MTRARAIIASVVTAAVLGTALGGCGEELPTEVGSGLLPGGLIRTIQVDIDASRFLVWDTAFAGYISPAETGYVLVADQFEGTLNANTLIRFGGLIETVTAIDADGVQQLDTVPVLQGGRVVLAMDTLLSAAAAPVPLRLYRAAETWDRRTASWTMRIDSAGERVAWQQPGGTRGALIGEGLWTPGDDSVAFAMDTLALRAWTDTTVLNRGAILVADLPGVRLRANAIDLRLDYQPSFRPDTLVTTSQPAVARTFIYEPTLPAVHDAPRVGGVPGWRSFVRLRERLDTLTVPCPDQPNCVIPLSAVTITSASLLLDQVPSPPGFSPNDSIRIMASRLLVSDLVPLLRSPIGETIGIMPGTAPRQPTGVPVQVPITALIRELALPPDTVARPVPHLALMPFTEGRVFGFVSFAPAPRLRLVLTVATEVQLR
jgi:hypothetical protein